MQSSARSRCFCPCQATLLFSSPQAALSNLNSVYTEDLGHLVQSPAPHVMARSLSEIVQQLYANDQLSQDCAHALSMQLGGADSISRQQMQGDIALTTEVSAFPNESSCRVTPSMRLLHYWLDGRCLLHQLSVNSDCANFCEQRNSACSTVS